MRVKLSETISGILTGLSFLKFGAPQVMDLVWVTINFAHQ